MVVERGDEGMGEWGSTRIDNFCCFFLILDYES